MAAIATDLGGGIELGNQALIVESRDQFFKGMRLLSIGGHAEGPGHLERVPERPEEQDRPSTPRCLALG